MLQPFRYVHSRLALLVFPLLLIACGGDGANGRRGGGAPVSVVTTTLAPVQWRDTIEALGTARANESVLITSKVNESVERVNFDSGDYVEAGQVLVDLSGRVELAGLEEARAAYREAEQQLSRGEELAQRQLIPASQIDTLQATRDAAKARMDAIRARLSDRVITAPFDGVLGLRQISPGSMLSPGAPITTLDDISVIKLDFSVPEAYLSTIAPGQTVASRSAAWRDETFTGAVKSIDSRVDPVTRAVTVRAEVPNAGRKLRPGMLLTVMLAQAPRQTLVLPELAVIQVGRQAYVYVVDAEGAVAQVPVRVGSRRRGEVEIVEGLQAGDRVVVEGTVKLRPGAKVVEAGGSGSDDDGDATVGGS